MSITFHSTTPLLRIFDVTKAKEFYLDFLGCSVDWEHRFGDNFPLYMQVARDKLVLHLTEHHGDCSPGAQVRVMMSGIKELHTELKAKNYRFMKPGLEEGVAGGLELGVTDPFGNQITFCENEGDEKVS